MLIFCLCISILALGLAFHACCLPVDKLRKDLDEQKHRIDRLFECEATDRILLGAFNHQKVNKKDFEAEMSKKANKDEIQQHVRAYLRQEGN
jgi:hypothetical protein